MRMCPVWSCGFDGGTTTAKDYSVRPSAATKSEISNPKSQVAQNLRELRRFRTLTLTPPMRSSPTSRPIRSWYPLGCRSARECQTAPAGARRRARGRRTDASTIQRLEARVSDQSAQTSRKCASWSAKSRCREAAVACSINGRRRRACGPSFSGSGCARRTTWSAAGAGCGSFTPIG